ncbi:MAG: glycosyltransferase [Balneolaceae bacterium]
MPKVSVIVPNYNHSDFLRERLNSIFNQTFQDFEVILLDDHSTDNSVDILKEYADHEKVSNVVLNSENSGSPFKQWQRGIELAAGEYIWIAESDDRADKKLLEIFTKKLERGVDLVYCRSVRIDEHGNKISDEFWPDSLDNNRWKKDYENTGLDEIRNYLAYRSTIPNASSCVFRKKEDLFSDEIINSRFTGDWLFWVNYLKNSSLAFISEPLNGHRYHSGATRARKDYSSMYLRLTERMRAIRLARKISGRGRIKIREYRKYKYLIRYISRLKKEVPLTRLFRLLPVELLFYVYLFEVNNYRHFISGKIKKVPE